MRYFPLMIAVVTLVGCGNREARGGLVQAAEAGNAEAVKQHIAAGVNVNAKVGNGSTALNFAAYNGHKEIVEL